ncbi:MAG TPA: MGMT family protein [Candidatus Dormibacteraeota bacterium]|nr:MGMT family protein [Candidatus Dormibacteraeota bacterium]
MTTPRFLNQLRDAPRRRSVARQARGRHESRVAAILERIREIPPGHVQTYGDIDPDAPRLVGRILATTHERNLPWHRVVRADGTFAKGKVQRELLTREGVPMRGDRVDLEKARA